MVTASINENPMITCEIGSGTCYVNTNGETGLVVEPGNSADLARAMNLLLADRDASERFGVNARHRYEQLFTGRAMGEAYASFYRALISAH